MSANKSRSKLAHRKAYGLIDVEKGEAGSVAVELDGKPGILSADVVLVTMMLLP